MVHVPLLADQPIASREEDRLQRGPLVQILATKILASKGRAPLVLAVNGAWGSGKSSVLNLLKLSLEEATGDGRPRVISFNPWHYQRVDQMVRMFFVELASTLVREDEGLVNDLLSYAEMLTRDVVGGPVTNISGLDQLVEGSTSRLRRDLSIAFKRLDRRLVVLIDDIDRLQGPALRTLLRLIRLNADFPSVTYVLAFDRAVVSEALTESEQVTGAAYLEKIVQAGLDIPPPEQPDVVELLLTELEAAVEGLDIELDGERWHDLLVSGVMQHFTTIRNVKRFSNALRLTLPAVVGEVDFVDFVGVEVLRVFHPQIHQALLRRKEQLLLTLPGQGTSQRAMARQSDVQGIVEYELGVVNDPIRANVRHIIQRLLPKVANAYQMSFAGTPDAWRRERRLCEPDAFDRYFLLAVPRTQLSESRFSAFIDCLGDRDAALADLRYLDEHRQVRRLLTRLRDELELLSGDVVEVLIDVLVEVGDELDLSTGNFFDTGHRFIIPDLLADLVGALSEEVRWAKLQRVIIKGKGFATVLCMVSRMRPEQSPRPGRRPRALSKDGWVRAQELALERVAGASVKQLWRSESTRWVLRRWLEWAPEQARAGTRIYCQKDAALFDLLGRLEGGRTTRAAWAGLVQALLGTDYVVTQLRRGHWGVKQHRKVAVWLERLGEGG